MTKNVIIREKKKKRAGRCGIVVGEFGEEESAHSDNGANQKEEEEKIK
jgi:hypothetical protein